MASFTALYDADVLYGSQLRNLESRRHPDEFVVHLLDLAPGLVTEAAQRHRRSLKNPAKTTRQYLEMLEAEGLTETAAILREYMIGRCEPELKVRS